MDAVWIILIIVNTLLYGLCCFILLKRKRFTCVSIRSPILLILNIIGNFLMTIITMIAFSLNIETNIGGKKICSLFYYITNFLIIVPLCLRFNRITKCCEINNEFSLEIQGTNIKKNRYQEKYYIKVMLVIFVALTAILLVANAIVTRSEAITVKFLFVPDITNCKLYTANSIIWFMINFVEHIIILTYVYKICVNQIKQKLRFEIIATFVIWFICSNLIGILEIAPNINGKIFIALNLVMCYLFLIINAIIPIIMSYFYKNSTIYSYPPKLMNNLYLFLSNETCYMHFKKYLSGLPGNGSVQLKLYIDIMNYKLGYKLRDDNNDELGEASIIRNEYFRNHNIAHIPNDILEKVKNNCLELDKNHYTEDLFDEALKYCYTELSPLFEEYKKSEEFKELYKQFFLTTYIQCKMTITGLINKY